VGEVGGHGFFLRFLRFLFFPQPHPTTYTFCRAAPAPPYLRSASPTAAPPPNLGGAGGGRGRSRILPPPSLGRIACYHYHDRPSAAGGQDVQASPPPLLRPRRRALRLQILQLPRRPGCSLSSSCSPSLRGRLSYSSPSVPKSFLFPTSFFQGQPARGGQTVPKLAYPILYKTEALRLAQFLLFYLLE